PDLSAGAALRRRNGDGHRFRAAAGDVLPVGADEDGGRADRRARLRRALPQENLSGEKNRRRNFGRQRGPALGGDATGLNSPANSLEEDCMTGIARKALLRAAASALALVASTALAADPFRIDVIT